MAKLTALAVKSAKQGRHADGHGLYLLVKPTGAKTWVLRVQADGERRDIGLGSVDLSNRSLEKNSTGAIDIPILHRKILTLGEAREKAGLLRAAAKAGLNPVHERDRERGSIPTFREATIKAHTALKTGWNDKGASAFLTSLTSHVFPTLGERRVDAITSADITEALSPIWMKKPVMARKVRQRVATVLNFAHNKGWRLAEAPSRSVTVGLPRQPKGGNFAAMPYVDVPGFVTELQGKTPTLGRQGLLFQILTAARPGEVRAAQWGQIDLEKLTWDRPGEMMKSGVSHVVTLSPAAAALLRKLKGDRSPKGQEFLFPSTRGGMVSDMTFAKVLRDAKQPFDAHGFRSSFRDWAAEQMPQIPDPVAEAAMAHVVSDKVIAAYKRTNFLTMRRQLLDAWAEFVTSGAVAEKMS